MTDKTGDPLRDPRFPDRPQHPDFWRIVDVVTQGDALATEDGKENPEIIGKRVDPESLRYMAIQRARKSLYGLPSGPADLETMLAAMFMDGFFIGVRFLEEGGHREP